MRSCCDRTAKILRARTSAPRSRATAGAT
ncbi:hypothetical protein GGD62_005648 [Bradyrhizobium sp. ERR14]|nr:hypothetical protein [Bradyrhizobium sp. ERR14]